MPHTWDSPGGALGSWSEEVHVDGLLAEVVLRTFMERKRRGQPVKAKLVAASVLVPVSEKQGWVALLHFVDGRLVEFTLTSPVDDEGPIPHNDEGLNGALYLGLRLKSWFWNRLETQPPPTDVAAAVTVTRLPGVRFGQLQAVARKAVEQAKVPRFQVDPNEYVIAEDDDLAVGVNVEWAAEAVRRSGPAGKPSIHYAKLAARYDDLVNRQDEARPVEVLAAEFGVSRHTMRNQLSEARRRDLITTAGQGRAGGHLTDEARRVLAEEA